MKQRFSFLIQERSGRLIYYQVLYNWEKTSDVDWLDSTITLHKSCISHSYINSEPLFDDKDDELTLAYGEIELQGSLGGFVDEILTLNAYVADPTAALSFFEPLDERSKSQSQNPTEKRSYHRHDWPTIYAYMWRYLALKQPPIFRGLQAQLAEAGRDACENEDHVPAHSQLARAADHVMSQYKDRDKNRDQQPPLMAPRTVSKRPRIKGR